MVMGFRKLNPGIKIGLDFCRSRRLWDVTWRTSRTWLRAGMLRRPICVPVSLITVAIGSATADGHTLIGFLSVVQCFV